MANRGQTQFASNLAVATRLSDSALCATGCRRTFRRPASMAIGMRDKSESDPDSVIAPGRPAGRPDFSLGAGQLRAQWPRASGPTHLRGSRRPLQHHPSVTSVRVRCPHWESCPVISSIMLLIVSDGPPALRDSGHHRNDDADQAERAESTFKGSSTRGAPTPLDCRRSRYTGRSRYRASSNVSRAWRSRA